MSSHQHLHNLHLHQHLQQQQQQPPPAQWDALREEAAATTPTQSFHYPASRSAHHLPERAEVEKMEDTGLLLEGEEKENQGDFVELNAASLGDDGWNSRGRTKSKKEKGKPLAKKIGSGGSGDQQQKNTVLLLIDDEKVKPIEVDLACKTFPKEHEAFTGAFLRQNDFAKKIFSGGDKLLKWYFQEDHLTFPRLCLIYQNRCSNGRTNPWVPKLIRNGPSLRGPVVLVQQKKSPNAETVVFDQYKREDRHMLPAAASFLLAASCGDLPTRPTQAQQQRNPMRASAPPLSLKNQGSGSVARLSSSSSSSSSAILGDDSVQPQHPYLSSASSSFSPTAPPYTIATLSSLPSSPSSSSPSSSSSTSRVSSPSTTPPSSVPHSPRSSFSSASGSMFVSSPATTTRPAATTSSSFPTLPIMQSDSAVSLSGSHSSIPPYSSPHFFSPPLSSMGGGGGHHPADLSGGFDVVERPTISSIGSGGGVPVSRSSEDFSAFSSSAFPYSLWAPSSSSVAQLQQQQQQQQQQRQSPQQQHSYSADGILSLSQHSLPVVQPHHPHPHQQPLSLSTSGIYVPSHHQYRPSVSMTSSSSTTQRPSARHFSWEGPLDRPPPAPVVRSPSGLEPGPLASQAPVARRASADGGERRGVDEQIVGQLKKIVRDPSPGSSKARLARLTHAYEEYLRTHDATDAGGPKKRSGSGRAAVGAAAAGVGVGVTRKTKLYCRTMIFVAKVARMDEKCSGSDRGDKRALARWEECLRGEVRDLLADGMIDRHLVDRMLLACFAQRRPQTACDLVREIAKQAPAAVSREEWALLADRYEAFSPWLAAFLRKAGERPQPADGAAAADASRDARVTLRIIRRRTGRDSRDHNEAEDAEEEMFRTVAPLSATVDELKQRLWQEQVRLLDDTCGGGGGDESQLLRPSDMSVRYRTRKGAEVHLHGPDTLHDYLLPQRSGAQAADYDVVIGHEPRLLAFAQFPDLAESLAKLKGMIDAEERDQWDAAAVRIAPHVQAHRGIGVGGTLYDYLCHHFEYLEEQNGRLLRRARKERQRRRERGALRDERQKKDAENGYRDAQGRNHHSSYKEKRIEAGAGDAEDERPAAHIVRFFAAPSAAVDNDDHLSTSDQRGRKGGRGRVERCAIHLGSLTKEDEEPLYAVFGANPAWPFHAHQRWLFHAWSDEFSLVDKYGLSTSSSTPPPPSSSSSSSSSPRGVAGQLMLPTAPRYFGSVEDLYLVPGVRVYLNAEHLLRARPNRKRFDQCAYPSKDELAFVTDSSRRASLDYALSRCLRALQNDPSQAVPHSRADASGVFRLAFLAPLYVRPRKSQKPDLVVSLERRYDGEGRLSCYVATSLLTPAQAYANARRVKKIRQTWLASSWRVEGLLAAAGDPPKRNCWHANGNGGLKRNKDKQASLKRNHAPEDEDEGEDEDEDEEDEFKGFEQEIEKWVSETEGEESEEAEDETATTSGSSSEPDTARPTTTTTAFFLPAGTSVAAALGSSSSSSSGERQEDNAPHPFSHSHLVQVGN